MFRVANAAPTQAAAPTAPIQVRHAHIGEVLRTMFPFVNETFEAAPPAANPQQAKAAMLTQIKGMAGDRQGTIDECHYITSLFDYIFPLHNKPVIVIEELYL